MLKALCILCALCLSTAMCLVQASEHPSGLSGAELAAAQQRTERQLEDLRGRYADLYLESKALKAELDQLRLSVAHILEDGGVDGSSEQLVPHALRQVEQMRASQKALCEQVLQFDQYLKTVLDVLQPSDVLRREILERFEALVRESVQLQQVPSLVAWRGGKNLGRRECRVLSVDDALQVVLLDVGERDGVRPGMAWRIAEADEPLARLKIVETRNVISAAVVVEGRLQDIAPGTVAVFGQARVRQVPSAVVDE